ncbi:MAG: Hpt domain-containing protein [Bacteroidetes bacterium]|nr:Hpt domain-containing protein [Bacteroidota bacterium]
MESQGENGNNIYDLTRLFEYVGTDPKVVKDMISLFIVAVNQSLTLIQTHFEKADYQNLAKESHKIKTSLQIFGFDDQLETIHLLEQAGKALPPDAAQRIQKLVQRLQQGIEALKNDFGL